MTTAVLEARTHEFDVEDIEYLRHGGVLPMVLRDLMTRA